MSVVTDVEKWGNSHRPGFLDVFRIALGVFLTYKGLQFITSMDELEMTASGVNIAFAGAAPCTLRSVCSHTWWATDCLWSIH